VWIRWHEVDKNIVAREKIGNLEVVTGFLGLNSRNVTPGRRNCSAT
jgi:hypothetical protein